MRLSDYLNARGMQRQLAAALGIAPALVSQYASGVRPTPPERCVAIERATCGQVTRRDLRPDEWWLIWPELVDADHPAPAVKDAA